MGSELFVARRLSLGRGGQTPLGLRIGVVGVALAFIVMLVSVSIVTGFKDEIRRKVMSFEPQIMLEATPSSDRRMTPSVALSPEIAEAIALAAGPEASVDTVISLESVLKTDEAFAGVVVRSLGEHSAARRMVESNLVKGAWGSDSTDFIVVSEQIARRLSLDCGSKVFVHFLADGNLRTRRLKVCGIYNTNFEYYDQTFAYTSMKLARGIGAVAPGRFTSIEINGTGDDIRTEETARNIEQALLEAAMAGRLDAADFPQISTARERGALYFNWLALLDTNVIVILALMAAVSGFTLISSLFILILQRISTIGLLKALGATDRCIERIFMILAQKIVLKGLLFGNIAACSFIVIQHFTHLIPLDAESYYLSYVPTDLCFGAWILLNAGTIVAGFIVLVVPSRAIARMSVTRALNYGRDR